MKRFYTTRQVAERFGVRGWQVRRLFEDGTLLEPQRLGQMRAIPDWMLGAIAEELGSRGWLPKEGANHE